MTTTPFDIDGATWHRVSPKLITMRTIVVLIVFAVPLLVATLLGVWASRWVLIAAAVVLIGLVWALWLIRRQVPAIGYAELEEELAVRRGIMFRSLTLVPYGRLQYIEVNAGPIARRYGIATVTLHTAAVASGEIPGLPEDEAKRLRDRLSKRSESMLAGL